MNSNIDKNEKKSPYVMGIIFKENSDFKGMYEANIQVLNYNTPDNSYFKTIINKTINFKVDQSPQNIIFDVIDYQTQLQQILDQLKKQLDIPVDCNLKEEAKKWERFDPEQYKKYLAYKNITIVISHQNYTDYTSQYIDITPLDGIEYKSNRTGSIPDYCSKDFVIKALELIMDKDCSYFLDITHSLYFLYHGFVSKNYQYINNLENKIKFKEGIQYHDLFVTLELHKESIQACIYNTRTHMLADACSIPIGSEDLYKHITKYTMLSKEQVKEYFKKVKNHTNLLNEYKLVHPFIVRIENRPENSETDSTSNLNIEIKTFIDNDLSAVIMLFYQKMFRMCKTTLDKKLGKKANNKSVVFGLTGLFTKIPNILSIANLELNYLDIPKNQKEPDTYYSDVQCIRYKLRVANFFANDIKEQLEVHYNLGNVQFLESNEDNKKLVINDYQNTRNFENSDTSILNIQDLYLYLNIKIYVNPKSKDTYNNLFIIDFKQPDLNSIYSTNFNNFLTYSLLFDSEFSKPQVTNKKNSWIKKVLDWTKVDTGHQSKVKIDLNLLQNWPD